VWQEVLLPGNSVKNTIWRLYEKGREGGM
jgi:hypothetical protein